MHLFTPHPPFMALSLCRGLWYRLRTMTQISHRCCFFALWPLRDPLKPRLEAPK
jgi:hypothetical protein